jgi:Holliday junction resolvase-like predicted endonuclease
MQRNRPARWRGAARAVSADERHRMIADAAYFLAEKRGFHGDAALDDWLQAEVE